ARLAEDRQVVAVVERQLGARDRLDPEPGASMRGLHRPVQTVVVGQRERLVAELGRGRGQFRRMRSAFQERKGGVAVQLDRHERMFAHYSFAWKTSSATASGGASGDIGGGWIRPARGATATRKYAMTVGSSRSFDWPWRRRQSLVVGISAIRAPAW